MKTLLLLRHAKSSWDTPGLRDIDRPLNERGQHAALRMGEYLRRQNVSPDLILCSPAERTRQTAALFLPAAQLNHVPLRFEARIYNATAGQLLEVMASIDAGTRMALVIGHNPGMEELIQLFTGESRRMPTAALACLELEIEDWEKTQPQSGRLLWLTRPKDLAA